MMYLQSPQLLDLSFTTNFPVRPLTLSFFILLEKDAEMQLVLLGPVYTATDQLLTRIKCDPLHCKQGFVGRKTIQDIFKPFAKFL